MVMITASLVLFENNPTQYELAIRSFIEGCNGILYVVDNSRSRLQSELFLHSRVKYFHTGLNLGFGGGHNFAIKECSGEAGLHLILNPDVYFESSVLPVLIDYMDDNPEVGVLMPRINYPNGSLQRLCKLLPTPLDLIFRRFIPFQYIKKKINHRYEMRGLSQDMPSNVPVLSGCFLLVRTQIFEYLCGFDTRFFMYMEDVDLVRRIGDISEVVYLPSVQVTHSYAKGSYRNPKLLAYHLTSAVLYFFKWGWFFDRIRKERNLSAIKMINEANGGRK